MARGTRGSAARSAAAIRGCGEVYADVQKTQMQTQARSGSAEGRMSSGMRRQAMRRQATRRRRTATTRQSDKSWRCWRMARQSSRQRGLTHTRPRDRPACSPSKCARRLQWSLPSAWLVSPADRRMAAGLPKPINMVLRLGLPPNFDQTDENTLGYLLKKSDLTWEKLVVSSRSQTSAGAPMLMSRQHCISSANICCCPHRTPTRFRRLRGYTCQSPRCPRTFRLLLFTPSAPPSQNSCSKWSRPLTTRKLLSPLILSAGR